MYSRKYFFLSLCELTGKEKKILQIECIKDFLAKQKFRGSSIRETDI